MKRLLLLLLLLVAATAQAGLFDRIRGLGRGRGNGVDTLTFWASLTTSTTPEAAKGDPTPYFTRASTAYADMWTCASCPRTYAEAGVNVSRHVTRWDKGGNSLTGLLVEQQRQNQQLRSDNFTTWIKTTRVTVIADQAVDPTGRMTADKVTETTTTDYHNWYFTHSLCTASYVYSYSAFVKDAEGVNTVALVSTFDSVGRGILASSGCSMSAHPIYAAPEAYGCLDHGNGWKRIWMRQTAANCSGSKNFSLWFCNEDPIVDCSYTGSTSSSVYAALATVEVGDFPSTPIPTDAIAATRLADILSYGGGYNLGGKDRGKGALYMNVLCQDYTNLKVKNLFSISDGGAATDMLDFYVAATTGAFTVETRDVAGANGDSGVATKDISDGYLHLVGAKWATDLLLAKVDSTEGTKDTDVDIPNDLDTIYVGTDEVGAFQPRCVISNVRIYKTPR